MKEEFPTDKFLTSAEAYCDASSYWANVLRNYGLYPRFGWELFGPTKLQDGSVDKGGGVLITLLNSGAGKSLRISQSDKLESGFLIAHMADREIRGQKCVQLSLHCSPTARIEGLIAILAMAWVCELTEPNSFQSALARLLPHEEFSD